MIADSSPRYRVVLVGDSSVGKTCILAQLVDHKFSKNEQSTIGANSQIYIEGINNNGKEVKVEMQIWDTAGQEKYRSLGPIYFRNASAALAVFDMTNKTSFENLGQWIRSFQDVAGENALVYIVANKSDLTSAIQISFNEAKAFASQQNFEVYETSALTGKNIQKMFSDLAKKLYEKSIPPLPTQERKVQNNNDKCC